MVPSLSLHYLFKGGVPVGRHMVSGMTMQVGFQATKTRRCECCPGTDYKWHSLVVASLSKENYGTNTSWLNS